MSRGERSRQERTSEERERDRAERERRRLARSGGTAPPVPLGAVEDEPALPLEPESESAVPLDPADEPALPADASLPDDPFEQTAPFADPLPDEPLAPELHEPAPAPAPAEDFEPHSPEHYEPLPPEHYEPPLTVETFEPAAAAEADQEHPTAAGEEQGARGFPIPGIEPPAPRPVREGLPVAPAPLRRSGRQPMRRAFRRGPAVSAAGKSRRGGGILSRLAALVALLAVVAAIVLLIHSLTHSSHNSSSVVAPAVVKILIPEGKTRVQIAQIAAAEGLKGSYRSAARRSQLLNPVHYGAPRGTPDLEGFLFPATYELDKGASAARLVEEQLTAFQENFSSEDAKRAHDLGVTPYQLLTVASMVEREAEVPGDRAKIAAVIYNRLKAGMPLGIDASIYYAVEQEKGIATYTHELTESQLRIDSPYNTRTHTGLPPTPISNPGTASIQAAAHPSHVAYLYYVAGADGCGEQVFSDTQAEFEANVAAYEAAKSKNGGHPPACKHH